MNGEARLLAALEAHPAFDIRTRERGRAYARGGRVVQVEPGSADGRLTVTGVVQGNQRYRTQLSAGWTGSGAVDLLSTCSCPVAQHCKHAYALVCALSAGRASRPPHWRSVLDAVLDEASAAATHQPAPPSPVAVELVLPRARPSEGVGRQDRGGRVAVRVLRRGAGRWVRGGMEWARIGTPLQDGAWAMPRGTATVDPDDLDALTELKLALLGRRGYLAHTSDPLDLHGAGPGLWRALTRLGDRGIPVLCSERTVEVRLSDAPAVPEVDVSAQEGSLVVRAGVVVGGEWFGSRAVRLVGEPAHGVVLQRRSPGGRAPQPTDEEAAGELVLAPLERPLPPALRAWFEEAAELTVETSSAPELLGEYLPAVAQTVPVTSRDGSVHLPGPATVSLQGDLTWDEDGGFELGWRWRYQRGEQVQQHPVDGSGPRGWRDRSAELALLQRLGWGDDLDALLGLGLRGPGSLVPTLRLRDAEAMRFATVHLPRLQAHPDVDVVPHGSPAAFREATGVPEVRFVERGAAERKNRTDWLDLEVVVSVDDAEHGTLALGLPRVLTALASGETVVMVRKGIWVDLDRPELDRLARLVRDARALADQPAGGLRVSREAHGVLAEVREIGATEGQLADWARASAALRDLALSDEPLPAEPLPRGVRATLRPYQQQGYAWLTFLRRHGLGGVLADDMGLGKTLQTLAMISRAQEEGGPPRPFLVVAPSSVVGTWRAEAERFTPDLRVVTVTASSARRGWPLRRALDAPAPADVVVTTYTLLRLEAEQYAGVRWAGLVLDEAQTVKNHRSKTWSVVRDLEADCRFAITGTPLENNLMELWAVLSLTAPGLYPHAEAFRTMVAQPIEQDADPEARRALLRRIAPVVLRRTKERVAADLPAKQEQLVEVVLSPRHRTLYDLHLQRERQRVLQLLEEDPERSRITILASLTRLRQLSLDPALVDPVHEGVGSAKIDQLVEQLAEVVTEGHRALVFSQFTGFLARVRARLDADGIGYAYLDGRTRRRQQVVDSFRTGDVPVFLISLKAGGVGLNLTEADYCFVLDPWWNPAVEAQAVDRAHRIGQTRPVMVYRYVAVDTVEQKVVELSARKAALFTSVLDADGELGPSLSLADLASLVD